jgi:hypothetical protein
MNFVQRRLPLSSLALNSIRKEKGRFWRLRKSTPPQEPLLGEAPRSLTAIRAMGEDVVLEFEPDSRSLRCCLGKSEYLGCCVHYLLRTSARRITSKAVDSS